MRSDVVEALQRAEHEAAVLARVLNPEAVARLREALWDARDGLNDRNQMRGEP